MIPFRTQRLATSVVNRIMNVHAGLPPRPADGMPSAPEPTASGAVLDRKIAQPVQTADADPQIAQDIALGNLP